MKTKPKLCGRRYPWDDWFSRDVLLVRGKDFSGRADTFMIHARGAAAARGLRLRFTVVADGRVLGMRVKRKGEK